MHLDWTPARSAELWQETEERLGSCGVDDPPSLTRLIRRMMVFGPAKRPTAAKFLDDPYFVSTKTKVRRAKVNGTYTQKYVLIALLSESEELYSIQLRTISPWNFFPGN